MRRLIVIGALFFGLATTSIAQKSIVDAYGRLSVKGNYIIGEKGDTVQLRGMSFFWSQWMGQFYNQQVVKYLKKNWNATVVRPAMGVEMGGYLSVPDVEKEKVFTVVDAAIKQGIYVIIDFHTHEGHKHTDDAVKFFSEVSKKYGKYPNVIYEIFNEPLADAKWATVIKPYAEKVIAAIRENDPHNLIIVGTRTWSQMVSEPAEDPIDDHNTAYTLHFYSATHKQDLRDEAKKALDKGICIFVTEYGTCDASGDTNLDLEETKIWFDFLDKYKISYCNWSIADKDETASALTPGANVAGYWGKNQLTPSGQFVKDDMVTKNGKLLKKLGVK